MNEDIKMIMDELRESAQKSLNHVFTELAKLRAGRATPSMLDSVMVEYYGSKVPLSQVANINTPDAKTIIVKPWEKGMLEEISQIVPFFAGVKWDELGQNGKQWPVKPNGEDTQMLHIEEFKNGKGQFAFYSFSESKELEKYSKDFPYIITTNRELEHYNCGAMTRRTGNVDILTEDVLLIHPDDAKKEDAPAEAMEGEAPPAE